MCSTMGQGSCKIMAKDLVRTRRYVSKFYQMRTQLQAVSLRLQTLRSNEQMAVAMKGATKVSLRFFSSTYTPCLASYRPCRICHGR